ncbi:RNA polymerase sigma factor SigJ [Nocardia uniformis]|uniref:RNA polymerase sigma factor SigJ n=1 Tax=Nocardia uniformis TaxID=53432 RepID=A0A849CDD2_9NOCA|nr:RNA polymerase sigma factor SigJ [Nocardia uniformis]NNH74470.1 RNA polymerase sigma factor SigJ [Nocardia uniformis]
MTATPPDAADDQATQVFVDHRELLFAVVYNMLGSVTDTEDVLQEVWLSWSPRRHRTADAQPIDNARAYLVRIAMNQALARRAAISRRQETYVGSWLPEPILTPGPDGDDPSETAVRTESFSMAVLVVLETLSPLERAVFVLHEVFGYPHTEIADILDRSPAAVRQLAHRARGHVQARRPRHQTDLTVRAEVTKRFADAALGGDLPALLEILAPDVTLWTDGGGKGPAVSLRPVHGPNKVARVFGLVAAGLTPGELDLRYRYVNGDPSALLFSGDCPIGAVVLDLTPDGTLIQGIYSVTNPDKLRGLAPHPEPPSADL